VVRFVSDGERAYALKEAQECLAKREHGMLRMFADKHVPAVEAVGLVTGRVTPDGTPLDAVLVTRYLDHSLPFSYLFGREGFALTDKLIDAAVGLLTRILLLDLQAGGRFPPDVDVIAVAERFGSATGCSGTRGSRCTKTRPAGC
jgi:hypothetical protein